MVVNILTLIPVNQWRSLVVVNIKALLDCFLVVIRTTALLTTEKQTLHQLILWNKEFNHSCHIVTTLSQHLLQSLCLWDCTWETIEDNTLMLLAKAIVYACKNIYHQLIRNELTIVNVSFCSLTKFCTILNFITKYVTC